MSDALQRLDSDDRLADALGAVLARAEAGDGTVTWADVNDAVPAEQWGQLLETDLLVGTDAGFVVADPDSVRERLDDEYLKSGTDVDADETDESGWSTADKTAGVGAAGLLASYQVPGAQETVAGAMHALLGPLAAGLPFGLLVAVLAVTTTLVSTAARSRLVDESRREALGERLETVQERLSVARERGDEVAVERLESRQRELIGEQLGALKAMLRPMVWTMLVTVPVFLWLTWLTANPAAAITPAVQVLPVAGRVVWTARLVGPMQVWMVWYFVCSVLSNALGKRAVRRAKPVVSRYRTVV